MQLFILAYSSSLNWLVPQISCLVLFPGPGSRSRGQGTKKARPCGRAVMVRAATYSPGCDPSTIGAAGLNFSVRDGKRWGPCAGPPNVFAIGKLPRYLYLMSVELSRKDRNGTLLFQVFGQLVPLGCAVAGFTPAAYRRCRLQRPSVEV